ncbi:MAG: hypothetical protein RLW68_01710 [Devosia marina]|uniref:hypothetical protein n=1 Tax=Devosia marina TaxID=2683198 RepID=UPI0032EC0F4E
MDEDINYKTFGEYLKAKGINPTCPICSRQDWAFISEREGQSYAQLGINRSKRDIFDATVVSFVYLHCRYCGFVAQFLREDVARWRDQHAVGEKKVG